MANEIKSLIDYYVRERGLPPEKIVTALENAYVSAYKKMQPYANRIDYLRAKADLAKGIVYIYATLRVVEDGKVEDGYNQVALSQAQRISANAQVGDMVEANVTPKEFGRIAYQTMRQTLLQKLLDAEKVMLYEEFKDRAGELVSGKIRRYERGNLTVDLGRFDGVMPQRERVSNEEYAEGDQMRFYIVEVKNDAQGAEVVLSRSHPNLVRRLFEAEVNEIQDRTVEIRGIAREAGFRTKVAVVSNDPNVDPVGACVGVRGQRVKNIQTEIGGERIDVIEWTEDPIEFVRAALSPVVPREITADASKKEVLVIVNDSNDLSRAIGRRGQNARLTSRLLGWDVQVRTYDPQADVNKQLEDAAKALSEQLGISEEIALGLVSMGGTTVAVLNEFDVEDISENLNLSHEEAEEVMRKVREANNQ